MILGNGRLVYEPGEGERLDRAIIACVQRARKLGAPITLRFGGAEVEVAPGMPPTAVSAAWREKHAAASPPTLHVVPYPGKGD